MKQIALVCGYRSQGNFTAAFRKFYGVCPTEYQQQTSTWRAQLKIVYKNELTA
jgi:AraC-like DNA-binding protein